MCESLLFILLDLFDSSKDENTKRVAVRYDIKILIPVLEKLIYKCDVDYQHRFYDLWERAYALAGRRSLEHFIDYMEMENERKVLENRRNVLRPFIYYLTKITFDENLKYIVASYPPSTGKSFTLTFFTAWLYGVDRNNSVIRMSYSDDLVAGFSRSVREILESPRFSNIFPEFKQYNGNPFATREVYNWKLKDTSVQNSHYAISRDGQVTGKRANKAMIFDDMTKGAEEATNSSIHQELYTKWTGNWINRRDGNATKFIFAGTMWSPEDILNRITEDREKISKVVPSKQFKYVWETEDGSTIFIRVPLLDENDETTCEAVYSTKEARELRDNTDEFQWACVYQQDPIPATGLEFAEELLNHYERLPVNEQGESIISNYSLAVLDTTRRGKDNASMPIFKTDGTNYYLIDCIFKKKAMTELYDEIISKIEQHNITWLVVENNTDTSLKALLETKLKEKGINTCVITEKYNTVKKEMRILQNSGLIKKLIFFKEPTNYKQNSDYGRLLKNLRTYSFDYPNKNDDAPDSLALFITEIVLMRGKPSKPKPVDRRSLGI